MPLDWTKYLLCKKRPIMRLKYFTPVMVHVQDGRYECIGTLYVDRLEEEVEEGKSFFVGADGHWYECCRAHSVVNSLGLDIGQGIIVPHWHAFDILVRKYKGMTAANL